ncbi:MAG: SGNH hydrolase domain-containing protein [Pseudohongiellaceae bacterium]
MRKQTWIQIPSYDIPTHLANSLGKDTIHPPLGNELHHYNEQHILLFARLEELAGSYDNFSWCQTAQYLCDDSRYISDEDWTPYYFDSNHLTLTGAHLL